MNKLDLGQRPVCRHAQCWEGGHTHCQLVPPIPTSMYEPGYWEEKMQEEAQMYREDAIRQRERDFPRSEYRD